MISTRSCKVMLFLFIMLVCGQADAARRVYGTLLAPPDAKGQLLVQTSISKRNYKISSDLRIERAQAGEKYSHCNVSDLCAGDYVAVALDDNNQATDITATYGIVKGRFSGMNQGVIRFADGRKLKVSQDALRNSADGMAKLKPGSRIVCRVSPSTNEVWAAGEDTAVKPEPAKARPVPAAAIKPSIPASVVKVTKPEPGPAKPKIDSIVYSPVSGIKGGDTISVTLKGTPGGAASVAILPLTNHAALKEISPGCYAGDITLPSARPTNNSPMIGYLAVNGIKAAPIQASKLITVSKGYQQSRPPSDSAEPPSPVVRDIEKPEPLRIARPEKLAQAVEPPADEVTIAEVKNSQPKPDGIKVPVIVIKDTPKPVSDLDSIVITMPIEGSVIRGPLVVKGQASPNQKVAIAITYSNGLLGIMKLAGQVCSNVVVADQYGIFRMGPISTEGILSTRGLRFTIKAYYPDRKDHGTDVLTVIGDHK